MDPLAKAGPLLRGIGLPAPKELARCDEFCHPRLANHRLVVNRAAAKSSHDILSAALDELQGQTRHREAQHGEHKEASYGATRRYGEQQRKFDSSLDESVKRDMPEQIHHVLPSGGQPQKVYGAHLPRDGPLEQTESKIDTSMKVTEPSYAPGDSTQPATQSANTTQRQPTLLLSPGANPTHRSQAAPALPGMQPMPPMLTDTAASDTADQRPAGGSLAPSFPAATYHAEEKSAVESHERLAGDAGLGQQAVTNEAAVAHSTLSTVKSVADKIVESTSAVAQRFVEGAKDLVDQAQKAINFPPDHNDFVDDDKLDRVSLVLHALDFSHPHQMIDVFSSWREDLLELPPLSHVVIVSRSRCNVPDGASSLEHAAAVQGLHGFACAVAKELGEKGITVNILSISGTTSPSAAPTIMEPLAFFLTDQCCYVDHQAIKVCTDTPVPLASVRSKMPLEGKTALVTGGARGIGEAIVHRLQREGATVCTLDLPGMLDPSFHRQGLEIDVADAATPAKIVQHLRQHYGSIDIMVHNAGMTIDKTIEKVTLEEFARVIDVNLESIMRIDKAIFAEKDLVNQGARWILMSSINGNNAYPGQTNYGYSKAAMIGYAKALGKHKPVEDMTVNVVAPGFIETDMSHKNPFLVRSVARRMNALLQGGHPEDVACATAFLALPGAQGIDGEVLRVCGGAIIGK